MGKRPTPLSPLPKTAPHSWKWTAFSVLKRQATGNQAETAETKCEAETRLSIKQLTHWTTQPIRIAKQSIMCESINRKRWIPTTRKELNQERVETSTRTTKLWENSRQIRRSIRVKAATCTLWARVEAEMTLASRLGINHRRWMSRTRNPRLKTPRALRTFPESIFINQPKITCK
jgi:hypothetical protein